MELGFETIGNATLICHDRGPLLATDPWTHGSAYFGSWTLQHEIPPAQLADIQACRYVWLSHGHPDHLSLESLEHLRAAEILLPDHYGERVHRELRAAGFRTWVLKDGLWLSLSPRLRIMSLANIFQDAVLLVDLDGRALVVNANDAGDRGAGFLLKELAPRFRRSFLLALVSHGDADMIQMLDEQGQLLPPYAERFDLRPAILSMLGGYGLSSYVPFATLHQYQRADSIWANRYVVRPEDFAPRTPGEAERLLPAYLSYDALGDRWRALAPRPIEPVPIDPRRFGDDWSERLSADEARALTAYFQRFEHLAGRIGYLEFVVGGERHRIAISPGVGRGIRFETPRGSLLKCIEWQVFDDLMIGNFTRTTLLGDWPSKRTDGLYPDFNPFVTKFGDNGGARTPAELRAYFAEYRRRGFTGFSDQPADRALEAALAPYLA